MSRVGVLIEEEIEGKPYNLLPLLLLLFLLVFMMYRLKGKA